jgi:hypothetical protein
MERTTYWKLEARDLRLETGLGTESEEKIVAAEWDLVHCVTNSCSAGLYEA